MLKSILAAVTRFLRALVGLLRKAAAVLGPFNFVNSTGQPANDFHAVFRFTGGSLKNPRLVDGPADAIIRARGNAVDIVFPTPVQPGGTIGFTVVCDFKNAVIDRAWWTWEEEPIGDAQPLD